MGEMKYDTIVVGGGIAGLTSAAYLARQGQRVLLLEKNRECGGLVNSFRRDGFHFDAGVRALEDAGVIFPMLEDLGIQLEVVKSPVSVGVGKEILNIEGIASLAQYRDLLVRLYPESEQEIGRFIRIVRKVMKNMDVLYGIENPVFKDLRNDRPYLFKKLLPWLPRFLFTVRKINRMNMPVEDYLTTIITNPSLRDIISQHFFKNTPVFFALSYFSLYLDYFYPRGGVGRLADVLKDKIIECGGEVRTGTRVTRVEAGSGRLTDEENRHYEYGDLIWAADLKTFYSITSLDGLSSGTRSRFEESRDRMMASRGGDSVFSIFLEVDEPLESFRKIAHGHFFYTPSKEGLGETHRADLRRMLDSWADIPKEKVLEWLDRFTRLNTYEISVPGLKDPGLVPEGKTGLIISFLAEYDLFTSVRTSGWYEEFILGIETRVLGIMADTIYPMLKDRVISHFSFSPLSIENRVGSSEGAITGWTFEKPLPVLDKIQHADRSVLTPLPSVYQAGQWAYSPAGVPMSILTGKLAADRVLKKARK